MGCISSKLQGKSFSNFDEKSSFPTNKPRAQGISTKGSPIKNTGNIVKANSQLESNKSRLSQKYTKLKVSTNKQTNNFYFPKSIDHDFNNHSSEQRQPSLPQVSQNSRYQNDKTSHYPNNKYPSSQKTDQFPNKNIDFRKTGRKVLTYKQSIKEKQRCNHPTMNSISEFPLQLQELVLNQQWPKTCLTKFIHLKTGDQKFWDSSIFNHSLSTAPKLSV